MMPVVMTMIMMVMIMMMVITMIEKMKDITSDVMVGTRSAKTIA